MARQPKVEVALLADAGAMVRGFRQGSKAADDFGDGAGRVSKAVGIMDKAVIGAAAAIGGGLVLALKNGFTGLKENEQASAQTAAAIKSTGGAANVTTGQIEKLADGIEKKSGMDAHAIQSGSNLLLTFTKIKNEAGDGNDIFDQTTKTMADMATAMGTDPKNAAMQLGKALNDPIKGVSALGRAGVQFTKEQKDQIKTLVESGDTMGAQKIILAELQTQFGGSADAAGKTFAGRMSILKHRFDEFSETLAAKLMPVLMAFMDWVERSWPSISRALEGLFDTLLSVGRSIISTTAPAIRALFKFLDDNRPVAIALVSVLAAMYAGFKLLMVARAVAGAVQLLNLAFLANPVVLIVAGVIALAAALVIAYKKSETFRNIVNRIGDVLKGVLMPIFGAVKSAIEAIGALLKGDLGGFLSKLGEVLKNLFEIGLKTVFALPNYILKMAIDVGVKIIEKVAEGAKDIAVKVWDAIKDFVSDITSLAVAWFTGLVSIGASIVEAIVAGVTGLARFIWDRVKEMPAALLKLAAAWFNGLVKLGGKVIDFIVSGVSGLASAIWNRITAMPQALLTLAAGWLTGLVGIGGTVVTNLVAGVTGLASAIWTKITDMPGALIKMIGGWAKELADLGAQIVSMIVAGVTSLPKALLDKMFGGGTGEGPAAVNPALVSGGAGLPGSAAGIPRATRRKAEFDRLQKFYRTNGPGNKITTNERAKINNQMRAWDARNPMALGGLVTGPTRAVIGEAGREAVVPLDNPVGVRALSEALSMAGAGGSGSVINLTFNGVLNAQDAARVLRPEIDRLVRLAI